MGDRLTPSIEHFIDIAGQQRQHHWALHLSAATLIRRVTSATSRAGAVTSIVPRHGDFAASS